MRSALATTLDTLHVVALCVWLGGLAVIGGIVAPAAFHAPGLTRLQAGEVVGESLRRLGPLMLACGLVMIATQFLVRRRYKRSRPLYVADGALYLLTFAALFLAEYSRDALFPALDSARASGRAAEFAHIHSLYTTLAMIQVALLVSVAALLAWMRLPRAAGTQASPAPSAAAIGRAKPVGPTRSHRPVA